MLSQTQRRCEVIILRILWGIISWMGFTFLINLPTILLGWILIPIAAACGAYEAYQGHDGAGTPRVQYRFTWKFMWLWDNEEDGIADKTYWVAPNMFLQILYWSCNRNPSHNLSNVPYLNCKIQPEKVRFVGSEGNKTDEKPPKNNNYMLYDTKIPQWFFAWQGPYSNFYWQFILNGKLRRFWIGWKIYPTDINGVTPYRKNGAGFATQWKAVK